MDPDRPLIETVGVTVEEALELLSKVGLNDAFLFLRTYNQLSDGQKYRYRIAKLVESGKQWWLMDEFAACLDRDTTKIIAFNLQKIARQQGKVCKDYECASVVVLLCILVGGLAFRILNVEKSPYHL